MSQTWMSNDHFSLFDRYRISDFWKDNCIYGNFHIWRDNHICDRICGPWLTFWEILSYNHPSLKSEVKSEYVNIFRKWFCDGCNAATHFSTLQHTATHYHTLPHTLRHAATHCNTLQHTATHCNTVIMQYGFCGVLCVGTCPRDRDYVMDCVASCVWLCDAICCMLTVWLCNGICWFLCVWLCNGICCMLSVIMWWILLRVVRDYLFKRQSIRERLCCVVRSLCGCVMDFVTCCVWFISKDHDIITLHFSRNTHDITVTPHFSRNNHICGHMWAMTHLLRDNHMSGHMWAMTHLSKGITRLLSTFWREISTYARGARRLPVGQLGSWAAMYDNTVMTTQLWLLWHVLMWWMFLCGDNCHSRTRMYSRDEWL